MFPPAAYGVILGLARTVARASATDTEDTAAETEMLGIDTSACTEDPGRTITMGTLTVAENDAAPAAKAAVAVRLPVIAALADSAAEPAAAQAILVTDDAGFGRAVAEAVTRLLTTLARSEIAGASWRDFGAIISVANWDEALALADRVAPEHMEICTADAETLAAQVRHAGAIFIGALTAEAIGDYVGGPNHVLPTARSARFSSGLSVLDFMKRTTVARMTPAALAAIGPAAVRLAQSEGLEAHALSVQRRLDRLNSDGRDA
jgi:histidinol dehydrogenase